MAEKNKDPVPAARLVGMSTPVIIVGRIPPDVIGPVPMIITEATPFFLGVGLPPARPSPGALFSIGNGYRFFGDRWIVAFPGLTLAVFVLAVNRLGDRLRDALNPRLR